MAVSHIKQAATISGERKMVHNNQECLKNGCQCSQLKCSPDMPSFYCEFKSGCKMKQ